MNADQMVTFVAFPTSNTRVIEKIEYLCVCVYNEFMLLHIYEIELFKLDLISTGMCMYKGDNQLNIRSLPYICVFFSCPVNKHILLIFSTYITDLSLKVLCVYVECARIHRILYVL